jgi:hypothetical protein
MGDLFPAFLERVLPAPATPEPPAATATTARTSGPIDGFYRATRGAHTTIEKVLTLVESSRATVAADGTLTFAGRRWSPTGSGLYRDVEGTERLAAVPGHDGAIAYLATDGPAYRRLAWYETPPFNLAVLAVFLVPALTVVVGWPLVALARRLRRRPVGMPARSWRTARWLAGAGSVAGLCFVVAFTLTLLGDTSEFLYGVPTAFRVLMLLPVAFVGLALAAAVTTVRARRAGGVGLGSRLHQATVIAGMIALTWFLQQWNLIGWRFG